MQSLFPLANVFIALLSEAYADVREELQGKAGGIFGTGFNRRAKRIREYITSLATGFQHDELDADGDGQISAKELAAQTGWQEEKATAFIRYVCMFSDFF